MLTNNAVFLLSFLGNIKPQAEPSEGGIFGASSSGIDFASLASGTGNGFAKKGNK